MYLPAVELSGLPARSMPKSSMSLADVQYIALAWHFPARSMESRMWEFLHLPMLQRSIVSGRYMAVRLLMS